MTGPAVVCSTNFIVMVFPSGWLFTNSMECVNNSSTEDGLNLGIASNIEALRVQFINRFVNTSTDESAPAVSSDLGAHDRSTIGLNSQGGDLSDGIHTTEAIAERSVQRSLNAIVNVVEVSTAHADETVFTTRLLSPAEGRLP